MKKGLLIVGAFAIVFATVPMFAAFEAHIINVTAHIENALRVHDEVLPFGTVFPQEYLERSTTIDLSDSFLGQTRVAYVDYVIKQKPKCECTPEGVSGDLCELGDHAPVSYTAPHECPDGFVEMKDLCKFLSKNDGDPSDQNDSGHPSYYVDVSPPGPSADDYCEAPGADATGRLDQRGDDFSDLWIIDLKVPPVEGYIGQDWPASCSDYVVALDSQDYGCDLWIEVTGIGPTSD